MEKTVIYCDRYGTEDALPVRYWIGRELDAAGDTEDIHERVDLCHRAAIDFIASVERELNRGNGTLDQKRWIYLLRSMKEHRHK